MNLVDLKPFLDDVIDSFAAVLDLELTVINASPLLRVSGTGNFRDAHKKNWENTYTLQVLQAGKPMTVFDTSGYEFTISADSPQSYSLILYPIILNQKVEGVIVLASFTAKQQQTLIENSEKLLNYMDKTASLISAKLAQQRLLSLVTVSNAQLSGIFESVKGGLLLYREGGEVLQMNGHAKKWLHYADPDLFSLLFQEVSQIAEEALRLQKILQRDVHVQNQSGRNLPALVVQARPIRGSKGSVVCVINPFQDLQDTITQNDSSGFPTQLVTRNPGMLELKQQISRIARYPSNVLILGESGTGKELVARAIHQAGPRRRHPFVTVNCAAIPETLLESELFGYEEGAFTGAKKGGRIGKFMLANTGTLFLDEIGDMPFYLQAKLLRVLSDRQVDRIGSSKLVSVDVHIIAATNKNLEEMIAKKEFREDLYYRLSVIPLRIPPLRERREDILLLAYYFIEKYNRKLDKQIIGIEPEVEAALQRYPWPGNVRELENCVEYMVNFELGPRLSSEHIPPRMHPKTPGEGIAASPQQRATLADGRPLKQLLRSYEGEILRQYNARYGGRPSLAQIRQICTELEISVASYYRKMEELQ